MPTAIISASQTMTFSIINSELSGKIAMVQKVINSKNVLPILDNIIFTVKEGFLHLTASDSENTLSTRVALPDVEDEVSFGVNSRNIAEAVKNIASEAELTFEVDVTGSRVLKVTYPNGMFSLPVEDAGDFPAHPGLNSDIITCFTITDSMLAANIGRTLFATAQDELRPVMNGIFFDLTEDCLAVVASDGHQLVRNKIFSIKAGKAQNGTVKGGSFILPKKPAGVLKNILTKAGTEVTVAFDDRNLEITSENFTLFARQIEGRYPNYNSVIPQSNPNIVTVNRLDMIAALKRISPFSSTASNLIRMGVEKDALQLDAEDYDFSKTASERVTCDYDGTPMRIGFKGVSVIELLDNISCEQVVAQLADPSRAGLFLPSEQPEDEEILMLLMPMLIND